MGYLNTDGSPAKTYVLDHRTTPGMHHYWDWNFGKRPGEELYNIAADPEYRDIKQKLKEEMYQKLKDEDDPRMFGRGFVFDNYQYMDKSTVNFYQRYLNGEKINGSCT